MSIDNFLPLSTCAPFCDTCQHHTSRMYKKPFCHSCSYETFIDRLGHDKYTIPRRYECYQRGTFKKKHALYNPNQLTFNF